MLLKKINVKKISCLTESSQRTFSEKSIGSRGLFCKFQSTLERVRHEKKRILVFIRSVHHSFKHPGNTRLGVVGLKQQSLTAVF